MSIEDVLTRVRAIRSKYDSYLVQKTDPEAPSTKDAFDTLYVAVDAELEKLLQRATEASLERNRATVAVMNAEIRRGRAILEMELKRLERLSTKKVHGVSVSELEARPAKVEQLWDKVRSFLDAAALRSAKRSSVSPYKPGTGGVNLDMIEMGDLGQASDFFKATEESTGLRQTYSKHVKQQDSQLEYISAGLERLKHIAQDMNEEVERQDPMLEKIETMMENSTAALRTNNRRLQEMILEVRSTRKFCIDIILIIVLLGLGAYLYQLLK